MGLPWKGYTYLPQTTTHGEHGGNGLGCRTEGRMGDQANGATMAPRLASHLWCLHDDCLESLEWFRDRGALGTHAVHVHTDTGAATPHPTPLPTPAAGPRRAAEGARCPPPTTAGPGPSTNPVALTTTTCTTVVTVPKAVGERLKIKTHGSGERGAFQCIVTAVPASVPSNGILHPYDAIIEVDGCAVAAMASSADLTERIKRSGPGLTLAIQRRTLAELRSAAQCGDPAAQFVLGRSLAMPDEPTGSTVARDVPEGVAWLIKAAPRLLSAGRLLTRGAAASSRNMIIIEAARQGHAESLHACGRYHRDGKHGFARDRGAAASLFRRGADQGHGGCASCLADL